MKRRDTIDLIAAAVIGPVTQPEAVVVGLPIDGELRIVGRSHVITTRQARNLASQPRPPAGPHERAAVLDRRWRKVPGELLRPPPVEHRLPHGLFSVQYSDATPQVTGNRARNNPQRRFA